MPQIIVKLGENVVQKFAFDKPQVVIGRALDNDLVIENLSVSRKHTQIVMENNQYFILDMNSANGTIVNGEQITGKHPLKDQDVITLGKHKLYFLDETKQPSEELPASPFDFDKTVVIERIDPYMVTIERGKPGNQSFKVQKGESFIGRDIECDVVINDWLAAKKHAKIIWTNKKYRIADLGTWKGTKVNGQPVQEQVLNDNDEIEIGATTLRFRVVQEESIPKEPIEEIPVLVKPVVEKKAIKESKKVEEPISKPAAKEYIASSSSRTFHRADCVWAFCMKEDRKIYFTKVENAITSGRRSCGTCRPGMEVQYVPYWEQLLNDPDEKVKDHVLRILKKLTGKDYSENKPEE